MKWKWPWSKNPEPETEPEPEPREETPLEAATVELFHREFPHEEDPIYQRIFGMGTERVRVLRDDGSWLLELVQGPGEIYRVRMERYTPPVKEPAKVIYLVPKKKEGDHAD